MKALLRQFLDPTASRRTRWTGAFILGLMGALLLRVVDGGLAARYSREYSAIVGRQIASQAEGLVLAASQKNISDPIGWALFQLGQGVEPRFIQVTREKGPVNEGIVIASGSEVEVTKNLALPGKAESAAVRVTVKMPSVGFLGTTTSLRRDVATGVVALLLTTLLGLFLQRRSDQDSLSQSDERNQQVRSLLPPLKEVLLGIGRQLRDIFGHFERLSRSTREVQKHLHGAREGFHRSIQQSRKILKRADELSGCTIHAEAAVLNLMLESSRKSEQQDSSPYPVHVLHQQLLDIRSRASALQRDVRELEIALEPTTTDLDLGYHAVNEAASALQCVPEEIRRTGEGMTEQGRLFQKLRQVMAG